jgi:putative ABC transport system permease protein
MLLFLSVLGIVVILFAVNRMNGLLNKDLGFNKDSTYVLVTSGSSSILSDRYVFSSVVPGFKSEKHLLLKIKDKEIKVSHQFISKNYFDFFNYKKLDQASENVRIDIRDKPVYINESALKFFGASAESVVGSKISDGANNSYVILGVVRDFTDIDITSSNRARLFQLSSDHLKYAFTENLQDFKDDGVLSGFSTFQQVLNQKYTLVEDILYSTFLFINIFILLLCLGYIGLKYVVKKDTDFIGTMSIGIHVVTLVISKTYLQLIAITVLLVAQLSYVMHKFWLGVYVYRIKFGWVDIFIVLTMILLTLYLICCPKKEINEQLKLTSLE